MFLEVTKSNRMPCSNRGTVAVEMALFLPFLCLFLLGVMEISVLIHNKAVITNASREGARLGIAAVGGPYSDTDIQLWVSNYVTSRLVSFAPSTTSTAITRGGSTAGSPLNVRVSHPYTFLALPNLYQGQGLGSSLTMGAETTMRME